MKLWCCLVLCAVVACGSKSGTSGEAKPAEGSNAKVAPAAAKPLAVAIVFEGWEMWVGNDDIEPPEGDRVPGVLKPFKEAFAHLSFKDLPAGSKAAVISYGEHATVRRPMGPIESLTAGVFGDQKDYWRVIDRNLVEGVTLGLDELAKVNDARRVLVVISDGTDVNFAKVKESFTTLAKRAAAQNVEVISILYSAELSQPSMISTLDPNAVRVNTADAIVDQLNWSLLRLTQPPVVPSSTAPPFTLALVMSSAEVWVGNDDITAKDQPDYFPGALNAIRAALDRSPLTGFPPGSQAMLVTYDSKAQTKIPLGPIEKLDARAIGVQRDYRSRIGSELVGGVRHALSELVKVTGERRVLVIVGDGNDTNNEAAKAQLKELAKQASNFRIEVYAFVYKSSLSEKSSVITELDPKAKTAATTDELTSDLAALFRVLPNHR